MQVVNQPPCGALATLFWGAPIGRRQITNTRMLFKDLQNADTQGHLGLLKMFDQKRHFLGPSSKDGGSLLDAFFIIQGYHGD